ncbi:MAG: DegT/DnrJ/EryC1/StrS family aminotransferase [Gemmatimonadota bacterium]|nr:DegT/DnrJ/EryC1/StrS family aminotransferase [Gemmatimonadota bacterium]
MRIRHQLPVYSPISGRAVLRAAREALGGGRDPRPDLVALLKREYDASAVLLCGSGTQALTISLLEALSRVGAVAVALPAFACFDVASAAVGADARIALYDLDPDTLAPDLESLERALAEGARVVVAAPLYGMPIDWEELEALARRYDAVLIEDAAQGNGALWKGRALGSLGEISVLSFGRGKGWTGGSGGAVLLHRRGSLEDGEDGGDLRESRFSDEVTNTLGLLAQWMFARPALYAVPLSVPALGLGQTTYRPPRRPGCISRTAATMLLATYQASHCEAQIRRANAQVLLASIPNTRGMRTISVHHQANAGYLRLPTRVSHGMAGFKSQSRALAAGLAPGYPLTLADLREVAARLVGKKRSWPGAQTLVQELVTVPTHSRLHPGDVAKLVATFGA